MTTADALKEKLAGSKPGRDGADAYAACVRDIIAFVFDPELVDGRREGNDVIFTNGSKKSLWAFLRWEHSSTQVMFATWNVPALSDEHLRETADRLGAGFGSLAFVVTRSAPAIAQLETTSALFKNFTPRKAILILSDTDLNALIDLRAADRDPLGYVQTLYRGFRDSVRQ